MPITGNWKARQSLYAGASRWGTGVNPIHAIRDGDGRNIAPDGTTNLVPAELTDPYANDVLGYCDEDSASTLYGYGTETGTADRPERPAVTEDFRGSSLPGFPSWGRRKGGTPGGIAIRAEDHGAEITYTSKEDFARSAAAGWENKVTSEVNDAETSDPAQYEMQTSMTQRDKTREGSQTSGRASTYSAPIHSRIPAMMEKKYSGAYRHGDMLPREQTYAPRPFWNRNAGTGDPSWMKVNETATRTPLQRTPPTDPYQGTYVGATDYGYTGEDVTY
jgi:hypothetical protein